MSSPAMMPKPHSSPYRETVLDGARATLLRLRRQDLVDLALAALVTALAMAETLTGTYGHDRTALVLLFNAAVTLPLALRRRYPLLTFAAVVTVIVLQALLLGNMDGAGVFLGLLVGGYSLGAHAPIQRAVPGMVAFVPAIMTASWLDVGDPFDDLAFIVTLVGGFWAAGRVVWSRNRLVERLAEQTAELERSREAEARALAAEQRARIGRDVHDVVAHSVSLMVVQAEAGEAQLTGDHPSAECLRAIQRVGRSTLTELRSVLGALSDDPEADGPAASDGSERGLRTPTPSLRDTHRLVADLAGAGLDVDLHVEGDLAVPSDGRDLAAYRIMQEALTNALRHAPASRVTARVRVDPDQLVVEVIDDGGTVPGSPRAHGTGRGLVGMRERARLYGGDVEAGPYDDGFRVCARIPLPSSVEPAT
jgi:signal transduction histidine kinase